MDAPGHADLAARRRERLKSRLEARMDIGEDRLQGQEGLECSEELLQRVRAAEEQLARTSAALKAILRLAWKRRDLAATFRLSRLLGGRPWGAKKRDYRALSAALPSSKGWKDEWTKPGAEGGMEASVLENWLDWRAQTRDLLKRSEIKAEVVGETRKDMEELMSSFRTVKKRRACPAGSPPAEIWTMLLHASRNLSPRGQGIGYQKKKIEPVLTFVVDGKALVSSSVLWNLTVGLASQLWRSSASEGKRVVHVLPSVVKQFFKVLLRTKRDMWSPPALADWLLGYIPGRRRESAVLIRQVTTWRLERLGVKSLTAFHDLTNAFGSVKWEAMDRAAERLLGPNCLLGQQRYRLATTTIPGMDGDIKLKIGEGGLMGDPLMVALFWVAFLPSTIRWQHAVSEEEAESGQLLAWHPWSGGRVDLSLSQYADDTTKQIVAELGEDVHALAKRVRCSNDVFDRALATDGFSQNRGKEELLMYLVGEGSLADRRLVRDGKVSLPGKVVTVARHLGEKRHPSLTSSLGGGFLLGRSVVVREQSVVEAKEVLLHWSCGKHRSIWNRGLVPRKHSINRLRRWRRADHGRVRTMSNKEVLRFWKLAPCDVEARVRRLKWAQTVVQDPAHHTQLITAMFGKLPSEPNPTLGPGGEILPEANPWAVRWMADLEELEPYNERRVIQRVGRDVRALYLDRELAEDFVAMDVTILRLRSLAVEVPPCDFRAEAGHPVELSEGVPQWRCCFDEQCEAWFESFKAFATHVMVTTDEWRWCLDR